MEGQQHLASVSTENQFAAEMGIKSADMPMLGGQVSASQKGIHEVQDYYGQLAAIGAPANKPDLQRLTTCSALQYALTPRQLMSFAIQQQQQRVMGQSVECSKADFVGSLETHPVPHSCRQLHSESLLLDQQLLPSLGKMADNELMQLQPCSMPTELFQSTLSMPPAGYNASDDALRIARTSTSASSASTGIFPVGAVSAGYQKQFKDALDFSDGSSMAVKLSKAEQIDLNGSATPEVSCQQSETRQPSAQENRLSSLVILSHAHRVAQPQQVFICSIPASLGHHQQIHIITADGQIHSTTLSQLILDSNASRAASQEELALLGKSCAGDGCFGSSGCDSLKASLMQMSPTLPSALLAKAAALDLKQQHAIELQNGLQLQLADDDSCISRLQRHNNCSDLSSSSLPCTPPAILGDSISAESLCLIDHSDSNKLAAASGAAVASISGLVNCVKLPPLCRHSNRASEGKISSASTLSYSNSTVDGINLEEIKEFAKQFKMKRLSLGLTQTQVGQALSLSEGPAYSQSAICRFEKLDITPKSAQKIKPVLEKWMQEIDDKFCGSSTSNAVASDADVSGDGGRSLAKLFDDSCGGAAGEELGAEAAAVGARSCSLVDECSENSRSSSSNISRAAAAALQPRCSSCLPTATHSLDSAFAQLHNGVLHGGAAAAEANKKRKRRTSFTPHALDVLNEYFEKNTHPTGAEMTGLAESLNYDREVVRVWFCNKRQALKNTIKKLKQSD